MLINHQTCMPKTLIEFWKKAKCFRSLAIEVDWREETTATTLAGYIGVEVTKSMRSKTTTKHGKVFPPSGAVGLI